jgi:uncharacterized 2Fe-2S/4Fe-4S cluster protein (DUF4445 family)
MAVHTIEFLPARKSLEVPTGTLISEALQQAGLELAQPCGGQGRCGRCAVRVEGTGARRRSTMRLTADDLAQGFALACQTVVEGDLTITIPPQERIVRRLSTDRMARVIQVPAGYDPQTQQSVRTFQLHLSPPSLDDSADDVARLEHALAALGYSSLEIPLPLLRKLGETLRQAEWSPWVVLDAAQPATDGHAARLIEISPEPIRSLGLAIDIGTTTVSTHLVDLASGQVLSTEGEYNDQIACGEDIISRIVYASRGDGLQELGARVRSTIHTLLQRMCRRARVSPEEIHKVVVSGNTTMTHLFLGLPPASIRLTPYIPTVNHPPVLLASQLDLQVHPLATLDCLPGVASYVGSDITAGVLACGLAESSELTLFIDVGTNGEMVLGTQDWMVACACSAGPAFEGAGVVDGMRATEGAIEEVWVHSTTYEPTYRVIGGDKPRGLCGSGLISLLAELFVTGVIDRAGTVKLDLETQRVRQGSHGPEYVVAWAEETAHGKDIALTKVDVDNLMRAKAAIYGGFTILASSVGLDLTDVQQVLVGGAFGKYINVEKAIQIGLLPDLPWDRFQFLGNTSLQGAYRGLLSLEDREQIRQIARSMTYVELSADNRFYDAFTAALFLPHTDISLFPSVAEVWSRDSIVGDEKGAAQ